MWCTCTCCADALERIKFERELIRACNCADYAPDEQCDCDFCVWALTSLD